MVLGIVKASGTATIAAGTPGAAGTIAVALATLAATDRVIVIPSSTSAQTLKQVTNEDYTFQVVKTAGTGFSITCNQEQNPAIIVDYVVTTAAVQTKKVADEDIDGDYITQLELDGTSASVVLTNLVAKEAGQRVTLWCSDASETVTVACKTGTTFDGTNTLATFNAASDFIELVALSTTEFAVVSNTSVVLSAP